MSYDSELVVESISWQRSSNKFLRADAADLIHRLTIALHSHIEISKLVPNAELIEYGMRDDANNNVCHWGGRNFFDGKTDPKSYPGYTLVERSVAPWSAVDIEETP